MRQANLVKKPFRGNRDDSYQHNMVLMNSLVNLYHLKLKKNHNDVTTLKTLILQRNLGHVVLFILRPMVKLKNTGRLTRKRMKNIDEETASAAMDFMAKQVKAEKPFFVWWNATRMHFRTHVKEENP